MHIQDQLHNQSLLKSKNETDLPDLKKEDIFPAKDVVAMGNAQAQSFWLKASNLIHWIKPPTAAYGSYNNEKPVWFPDGVLNACYNCLDIHCLTPAQRDLPCFHHISPLEPSKNRPVTTLSYGQVLEEVQALAGVLRHKFNVQKGDRVVIYMSMVPEAAMAMLACIRIGAIHSFVFGGFAAKELAKRIDDAKPKLVIATSAGIEPKGIVEYKPLLDQAFEFSKHAPNGVLILRRNHLVGHKFISLNSSAYVPEFDFKEQIDSVRKAGKSVIECVPTQSSDPLYILYTSGTTGNPKGVVRTVAGYIVTLGLSMQNTFGLSPGETIFTASDFGWVVGHSYILYGPLIRGCTSVIFEGKPILPDAGIFWKIVQDYHVKVLFTAPTALRAITREDENSELMDKYNLKHMRALFVAGERCEPSLITRYSRALKKVAAPGVIVNDNFWSTESGSPITCICLGLGGLPKVPRPGSAGPPQPGMDVRIVDDEGVELLEPGSQGNVVLAQPLGPSFLTTLWNDEARFHEAYLKRFHGKGNWFDTGDSGMIDEAGFVHVLSRSDDVINVAGHRLSTSLLEQVIAGHEAVAECCVVGKPDELKGHVPFALITPSNSDHAKSIDWDSSIKLFNQHIRQDVGAIASLGGLAISRLPKTRSGKTLRRTVRELVENAVKGNYNAQVSFPPTIEDPTAVEDAKKAINAKFCRDAKVSKL